MSASAKTPELETDNAAERKKRAASFIKNFAVFDHDEEIGKLSDEQIKELIESRYE